jgi:hypothetical protein
LGTGNFGTGWGHGAEREEAKRTVVKDATAALSQEMLHAAHELNGPTFAHAILTTAALVAALPYA